MKIASVVIPVYYNQESIPALYERLAQVGSKLLERSIALELIFIDDGSGDNSLEELLKIKARDNTVKVIKLTRNFGSVHAIKAGLDHLTGDCFSILAADLQDPPEMVLEMVKEWEKGAKFVICEKNRTGRPIYDKTFCFYLLQNSCGCGG